jgi:hypothetical protein
LAAPALPLNPLWALLEAEKIAHGAKSHAANNPLNFVDPSGLSVRMVYDRASGVLTATDTDTGETITITGVFSGMFPPNSPLNSPENFGGPIPAGEYVIGGPQDMGRFYTGTNEFYPLLDPTTMSNVHQIRTKDGQTVTRNEFYLHPGTGSEGCITVPSDTQKHAKGGHGVYPKSAAFDKLDAMLRNTKWAMRTAPSPFSPYYQNVYYPGTVIVK